MTSSPFTLSGRVASLLGSVLIATTLLTGCSSSGQQLESSSDSTGGSSSTMTKERALSLRGDSERKDAEWSEKFTACLARNGVADTGPAKNSDPRAATVSKDCQSEVGDPEPLTPEEQAAVRMLTQLTFECLRKNGANIPDLTPSGDWNDFPVDFDWDQFEVCADGGDQ
ncbi:hypothetical protein [Rathayibacter tritici]|uniref:hypothetical protein n=1 Tax=Rathayibacter tritici TaxID=33888 RepID=UPI001474CC72|nr:hypothetical protein [Rathayibacter tritici]